MRLLSRVSAFFKPWRAARITSSASLPCLAEQAEHVEAQRNALAEALHHATNRYRAGYSPFLDQLDAQRGLLSAELSLVQLQADGLTASVNLYRTMGGGWQRPVR